MSPLVIAVVFLAIGAYLIIYSRRNLQVQDRLAQISGKIDQPVNDTRVTSSIACSGSIQKTAQAPEACFYLAVETSGQIRPKEPEIAPGPDGRWSVTVCQEDWPELFSITLWAVTPEGAGHIKIWLDNGKRTGEYPGLTELPGARRLAEVSGLQLEPGSEPTIMGG